MAGPEDQPSIEIPLPAHESEIADDDIVNLLREVVEAKQALRSAVLVITNSIDSAEQHRDHRDHWFASAQEQVGDVEAIMQGPMSANQRADGIIYGLDKLAALDDGTSWDRVAIQLAEQADQ
jgi:hypothetical protein